MQKAHEKVGIPCANLPAGFWKYDRNLFLLPNESIKSEEIPILENQIPEIDKYCSIFRTIGERRLRSRTPAAILTPVTEKRPVFLSSIIPIMLTTAPASA